MPKNKQAKTQARVERGHQDDDNHSGEEYDPSEYDTGQDILALLGKPSVPEDKTKPRKAGIRLPREGGH